MSTHEFLLRSPMPVSAPELFAWHMRRGAFERLAPPWEEPIVDSPWAPPTVGKTVDLQVPVAPGVRFRWVSEFVEVRKDEMFRDVQQTGPFASFDHQHKFEPAGPSASMMEDRIKYSLLGGPLGGSLQHSMVRRKLEAAFAYRHRVLHADLTAHNRSTRLGLRVLISGATGLVGGTLVAFLQSGGHDVFRLTRRPPASDHEIEFDPAKGAAHPSEMEDFDAVVHLAGDSIADGRWTAEKKKLIRDSRVPFTKRLAETLAALKKPPRVFISASAIGYYGDRADRVLRESDPPGSGFLPDVCVEWEGATEPTSLAGIRVIHLRTGLVLTPKGGALAPMLIPFKLGLGGPLGSGTQWWSPIALDDLIYLIHHIIITDGIRGPVNGTAPEAVTNAEFTRVLGRVLKRPAVIPVPKIALDLALGEMAEPLMFSSARVNPEKALDSGFTFTYPTVEGTLRHVLGRV
ncbi:MAG: TIGR01777 family oxidoreductase [Vicinamibacteria bacterium]